MGLGDLSADCMAMDEIDATLQGPLRCGRRPAVRLPVAQVPRQIRPTRTRGEFTLVEVSCCIALIHTASDTPVVVGRHNPCPSLLLHDAKVGVDHSMGHCLEPDSLSTTLCPGRSSQPATPAPELCPKRPSPIEPPQASLQPSRTMSNVACYRCNYACAWASTSPLAMRFFSAASLLFSGS